MVEPTLNEAIAPGIQVDEMDGDAAVPVAVGGSCAGKSSVSRRGWMSAEKAHRP